MSGPTSSNLPRLAVISDVPVERGGGGSLLLYRLLEEYPAKRLRVVYNPAHSLGEKLQRPGVEYRTAEYRFPRLIRNRFNPAWPVLMARYARRCLASTVLNCVQDFDPQAILTIPHWYLWFAAAAVAQKRQMPLHLMVHDDWPTFQTWRKPGRIHDAVRWAARRELGRVYRQARSRLCVSPGMVEHCQKWFGVEGSVLYPSRGEDSPVEKIRVRPQPGGPPVVAFCGWIHQDGTVTMLRQLAEILAGMGGRLDLYTKISAEQLGAMGLSSPAIRLVGFYPASEMGERIGETAHALFVPGSFEAREQIDVATLFPSKLADYTAIGLPILIWGPGYCSAARWAVENPGAAILVTEPAPSRIRDEITRLIANPDSAAQVAGAGLAAGHRYFTLTAARETFLNAIVRANDPCR